jgi:hypothetical protein
MDPTKFALYAAFVATSFVWVQWRRKDSRLSRLLGVLVLGAIFIALPALALR